MGDTRRKACISSITIIVSVGSNLNIFIVDKLVCISCLIVVSECIKLVSIPLNAGIAGWKFKIIVH